MKRVALILVCLLLLALAGCASVNQTNSFVAMPSAGAPEASKTPETAMPPVPTQQPAVQLDVAPAATPIVTDVSVPPVVTDTPAPSPSPVPTQELEGSPGGFNG